MDALNLEKAVKFLLHQKGIYPENFDDKYEEIIQKFLIN
jgi:hypothetical protein